MQIPIVGDQVPRRDDPKMHRFGHWVLESRGWQILGDVPNLPKLVVIGAPHTSNTDGLIAMSLVQVLRVRIAIMGKDSLFRVPLLGQWLRWLGLFPIDRKKPQGVVEQCVEQFKAADQFWLGLSPEGTRKQAFTWKRGFHRIAILAEVPIVMVALDFGRRELRFSELLYPSGDYERDLQQILHYFADAKPCNPAMLSLPLSQIQRSRKTVSGGKRQD